MPDPDCEPAPLVPAEPAPLFDPLAPDPLAPIEPDMPLFEFPVPFMPPIPELLPKLDGPIVPPESVAEPVAFVPDWPIPDPLLPDEPAPDP
jgi:hypothetical protein